VRVVYQGGWVNKVYKYTMQRSSLMVSGRYENTSSIKAPGTNHAIAKAMPTGATIK
jgi:uncharacterized protein (DUF2062 family)